MSSFRPHCWMEDLSKIIADRSLHQLILPGSHNSGTSLLECRLMPGTPVYYGAVPSFIRRWSCCQSSSVAAQLRCGVRYLDLRTARLDGELRVVHTCVGTTTMTVLEEVAGFLQESNQEIIVLDFQHFYDLTKQDHALLVSSLERIFGRDRIIPPQRARASLSELWRTSQRVLVLYGSREFSREWPGLLLERRKGILSPWAGDGHTKGPEARRAFKSKLEEFMTSSIEKCNERLFVLQCVSGPDTGMIVRSLLTGAYFSNLKSHALSFVHLLHPETCSTKRRRRSPIKFKNMQYSIKVTLCLQPLVCQAE